MRRSGWTAILALSLLVLASAGVADQNNEEPTPGLHPHNIGSPFPGEIARFGGLAVQLLVEACHSESGFHVPISCEGEDFRHTTVWLEETPTSYLIAFMFAPGPKCLCDPQIVRIIKPLTSTLPSPLPLPSGAARRTGPAVVTDGKAVQILDEACTKMATQGVRCEGDWIEWSSAVVLDGERYYTVYFYPSGLKATVDRPLN